MFPHPLLPKRDSFFRSPLMVSGNMADIIKGITTTNLTISKENLGIGREAEAEGIIEAPEEAALANPRATKLKSRIPEKGSR